MEPPGFCPGPQAASVQNVVSSPKYRVSVSTEPPSSREHPGVPPGGSRCAPEALPFLRKAPGKGLFQAPCRTQQSLADPASRFQVGEPVQCRSPDFLLFVSTAAKSLLNKKSDGGVKVGVSPAPCPETGLSTSGYLLLLPWGTFLSLLRCFMPEGSVPGTAGSTGLRGKQERPLLALAGGTHQLILNLTATHGSHSSPGLDSAVLRPFG